MPLLKGNLHTHTTFSDGRLRSAVAYPTRAQALRAVAVAA